VLVTRNRHDAPIGPRGYVLCRACHQEVKEISRDTPLAYSYHPAHRPWNKAAQDARLKGLDG
jgi:hypothetical protein